KPPRHWPAPATPVNGPRSCLLEAPACASGGDQTPPLKVLHSFVRTYSTLPLITRRLAECPSLFVREKSPPTLEPPGVYRHQAGAGPPITLLRQLGNAPKQFQGVHRVQP